MAAGSYNVVNPAGGSGTVNTGSGGSLAPWYIDASGNYANNTKGPLNNNGLRLGPADATGVDLSWESNNLIRAVSGDGSLNSIIKAFFRAAAIDGSIQYTDAVTAGGSGLAFLADGSATSTNIYSTLFRSRPVTASKSANYTMAKTDTSTVFDNTGATGTVNFTLPTATLGQTYTFTTTVAQVVSVTPQAGDTIVLGAKASGTAITSTAAKGGYLTLTCTAANTWAIAAVSASPSWS